MSGAGQNSTDNPVATANHAFDNNVLSLITGFPGFAASTQRTADQSPTDNITGIATDGANNGT